MATHKIKSERKGSVRLPDFTAKTIEASALSQMTPWLYNSINVDALHNAGYTGEGQVIAVLDTGTIEHPDLVDTVIGYKEFGTPSGQSAMKDRNGHGVWCHGIMAAQNNTHGIKGTTHSSKFLIQKVLSDGGYGSLREVVKAGDDAAANGATIITASLGAMKYSKLVAAAIKRWTDAGIVFICAAGNEGRNGLSYPGRDPRSITIGAIDQTHKIAGFSSVGKEVDVVAPGVELLSCWKDGGYAKLSGTSMATPVVAGIVACIKSIPENKDFQTQKQIERLLSNTADDYGTTGHDHYYGHGLINPERAMNTVLGVNTFTKENALASLSYAVNYVQTT